MMLERAGARLPAESPEPAPSPAPCLVPYPPASRSWPGRRPGMRLRPTQVRTGMLLGRVPGPGYPVANSKRKLGTGASSTFTVSRNVPLSA